MMEWVEDTHKKRLWARALAQFALYFVEQVAELLAPLCFLAGLAWGAVLRAIGGMAFEDEKLREVVGRVPSSLHLAGHSFTPGGLVWDGLLLMAVVAACRTAIGMVGRGM